MNRYLLTFFAILVAGFGVFAATSAYRYWVLRDLDDDERLGQLVRYQEEKIERLPANSVDTVFIGDSSLGNALDVGIFDAATQTRSVSLALAGNFGYGGGLVLLERLAERQTLRNVVLFYSIDAMALGAEYNGYFFTSPYPFEADISWNGKLGLLRTYATRLLNGQSVTRLLYRLVSDKSLTSGLPPELYADDYVVSRAQIKLSDITYHVPQRANPKSATFLAVIGRLCKARKWNCVYVHGPVLAKSLAASQHSEVYLAQARAMIEATGIRTAADTPLTMEDDERGDTVFHVSIVHRPDFTRRHAKLLRPFLK